jgi:hypothetical protein
VDNGTRWVGIDLHRRRSFLSAITEEGEVAFRRRIVNDRQAFLGLLGDPEGTHVALRGDLRLGVAGGCARGRRL